jgi:uncharacterized membrane protein YkvI
MHPTQTREGSFWQSYLLPPFSFMSVVIGGGYATGRELAEFFMPAGPVGGLLGMLVTAFIWSIVFALSLELARATQSFEYRSFFRQLLGPGWILFELVYIALMLLVLAVVGAACGEIAAEAFGTATWIGTGAFVASIGALVWWGTAAVERFLSLWGAVVCLAYAVLLVISLGAFDDRIAAVLAGGGGVQSGWISGGLMYAGYNLLAAPALLFCARHQSRRRESIVSGMLAGPLAMLPGALFFIAMLARYPEIASSPVPLNMLLHALDAPWLTLAMQIAIFGTLVQTGLGILHGLNERVAAAYAERVGSREHRAGQIRIVRAVVSLAVLLLATVLADRIGLVDLIAKGYGYLSWVIIAIYVVPLLTIGLWRLQNRTRRETRDASAASA